MSKTTKRPQTKSVPKKNKVVTKSGNSAPISSSIQLSSKTPKVNGGKRFNVSHTEFISSINIPNKISSFNLLKRLRINPGSAGTFQWLSTIAINFEFYRFKKLKFHYITRAPTTKSDSIIMSPEYDASEGVDESSEQKIFNNVGTVDDVVWKNISLVMSTQLMNRLYSAHTVMSDPRFKNTKQDQKTVDAAQVSIYCEALPYSSYPCGKLVVEYEVEFWAPQNPTEALNIGGQGMETTQDMTQIVTSSSRPLDLTSMTVPEYIDTNSGEILQPSYLFKDLITFNNATGVLGRFTRDYQGFMDAGCRGTNVDSSIQMFKSSDPKGLQTAAGDISTDIPLKTYPGSDVYRNAAGTRATKKFLVDAKKGDLLKVFTPSATSISMIENLLGGFSSPFLDGLI